MCRYPLSNRASVAILPDTLSVRNQSSHCAMYCTPKFICFRALQPCVIVGVRTASRYRSRPAVVTQLSVSRGARTYLNLPRGQSKVIVIDDMHRILALTETMGLNTTH